MLPLSRNRTYTDATPIVPGDMNDLQDDDINLWALTHGARRRSVPCGRLVAFENGSAGTMVPKCSNQGVQSCLFDTAGGAGHLDLPFVPGDRILSLRVAYLTTSVAGPAVTLMYVHDRYHLSFNVGLTLDVGFGIQLDDSGETSIEQWNVTAPTALWLEGASSSDPLLWAKRASVRIAANANNLEVLGVEFVYDTTDIVVTA